MNEAPGTDPYELPAELAEQAIERILAAEPSSRAAVLRDLLASHAQHGAALRRIFMDLVGTEELLDQSFPDFEQATPEVIGGYRVVRRIGEGAFGIVHLCEQERPVRRSVAVKVLRPGAGDRHTLRRFEAERQLLATLNHGSITQIFDAGHLPDGRPFFVMEYVDGLPITTYCEQHRLDCAARLRLFVDLCRGIEHAHARGIVHRDLKPANVLVVDAVPTPQPKIIDFGIAKALDAPTADGLGAPGSTDPGRVIGTPGYMSPEQAGGLVHAVDARADIFALGVMLYELLTGEMPWGRGEAPNDRDPELPSARVTTRSLRMPDPTPARPRRLAALLRGDLDWITLKALSRERERRYQSARELIEDIERHCAGRPVLAGPPSVSYRLAKFVRRNRAVVYSLGGALLASALALSVALVYTEHAGEAQAQARTEASANFKDATAAAEQLLARARDERMRRLPQSDRVRQLLLQDALGFYDKWLAERPTDPGLQAQRCRALLLLSRLHWQLGQIPDAQRIADEASAVAAALCAATPDDVERRALLADALRKQGTAAASAGRTADALPLFVDASRHLEACFRATPTAHGLSYSSALREVAMMQQALGRTDESLASFGDSLRVLEQLLPSADSDSTVHSDVVIAGAGLAQQLLLAGRPDDAEPLLLTAEARLPAVTFDRLRATATVESLLGDLARQRHDPNGAVPHIAAAVAAAESWSAAEPQRLMPHELEYQCARRLGTVHEELGAWADATAAHERSIRIADAMVAQFRDDPLRMAVLASTLRDLSHVLWSRARRADLELADAWARRGLALRAEVSEAVELRRRGLTWLYELRVAQIADGLGRSDGESWEHIATALGADADPGAAGDPEDRVEAWVGVARDRLVRGLADGCAAALAEPRRSIASGAPLPVASVVEVARVEAQLATANGDHAASAAAAERILAALPAWTGKWRAAEALLGAWRAALAAPDLDPATGAGYRDRAALLLREVIEALQDDVAKTPDDPRQVVPWGFAGLWLAELEDARGDRDAARAALARALPALRRVEPNAHRDQWDGAAWRAAGELERKLATTR